MDGIARTHQHAFCGCFAGLGHGRLAAGQRQASGGVGGQHLPIIDRYQGPVLLDPYQTFRTFHAGVHETGHDLQVAGDPAEEMEGTACQFHHGTTFGLHAAERDRGVLVQPQQGLVFQGEGRPALFVHPDDVTGAEGVIQLDGLPQGCSRPLNRYIPLD
ncbi:MAG: hypothetical protein QNI89_18550 [Desulfobacterales bacterium]|nr:hypothetical protein [Desulfobacterales bacterium]